MGSPVPRYLRSTDEEHTIPLAIRNHKSTLIVRSKRSNGPRDHPAKYAPGLATALVSLAGTDSIGDPFAGVGTLASETQLPAALNDIDPRWRQYLLDLHSDIGCEVTFVNATAIPWYRDTLIFSPPYYPRTDRLRQASHPIRRGSVVGYRTGYSSANIEDFIGEPAGASGILTYRNQMRIVYAHLKYHTRRMIVVVKNQTRLGVELRLDLDTILTTKEVGWRCTHRDGWEPPPSLWARYNLSRGTGVAVEDVLTFEHA